MNKHSDINKRVDEALNSLDGLHRAEPQPFFYTRLIGRLQRDVKTPWEAIGSFLARPVVVVSGLCVILVFNALLLFKQTPEKAISSIPTAPDSQLITDNEYILASSSSFDYENLDQQ